MRNENSNNESNERRDQVWPGAVQWNLGIGREHRSEILWQCDALRAGKLYSRTLFGTRGEAEEFVERMREVDPDHIFNVEAIKASQVWN